jgi:predicted Zn-dependent protease
VRNPVTGRLELNLLSRQQEIDLGQQGKNEVEATIGVYQDARLGEYVASVGKQIAAVTKTDYSFSYEIADDSSVNAFALPGGPVFITRGILAHMTTEAEMAAVLGHESGHVVARHSATQISKQQMAQLGLGIGSILSPTAASLAQAAGVGLQVLFLKYSREDETQADELGFRFMTKAGWDPHQMIPLFHMLDNLTGSPAEARRPSGWRRTPTRGIASRRRRSGSKRSSRATFPR